MNTEITYLYRDADNYKEAGRVVVSGQLSAGDIEAIQMSLDEERYFIASRVGFPPLQRKGGRAVTTADHVWHELDLDGRPPSETSDGPTVGSASELVARFRNAQWDESVGRLELTD